MGYACLFNGSTSKIDLGSDVIGTKAFTVMGWIKPYGLGGGGYGRVIDNTKVQLGMFNTDNKLYYSNNGSTLAQSAVNSVLLNKWTFVVVTDEADGTVNFYIGDKNTAPALSGSADQASGTPEAGTTNIIIGNKSDRTRTFNGLIPKIKVVEGILTLNQITQVWSETRKEII